MVNKVKILFGFIEYYLYCINCFIGYVLKYKVVEGYRKI